MTYSVIKKYVETKSTILCELKIKLLSLTLDARAYYNILACDLEI
jgi:hypothetical protein